MRAATYRRPRTQVLPSQMTGCRSYYSKYGIARKTFSPEFQDSIDLLLLTPDEVLRDGDTTVDGESFMTWLETGEGESWENAEGSGG